MEISALSRPDADGWYAWDFSEYFACRWMALEARFSRAALACPNAEGEVCAQEGQTPGAGASPSPRFVAVPICSEFEDGSQVLTIVAGSSIVEQRLSHGWHVYDFGVPGGFRAPVSFDVTLRVNKLAPAAAHPSDPRELGLRVGRPEFHDDARRHERARAFNDAAFADRVVTDESAPQADVAARGVDGPVAIAGCEYRPRDGEGWHEWELHDCVPFRWMKREASVNLPATVARTARYCTVAVTGAAKDLSQTLSITAGEQVVFDGPLVPVWTECTFELPSGADAVHLAFRVNTMTDPSSHPDDPRDLGARIGVFRLHDDEARVKRCRWFYDNAVSNQREFLAGASVLASFPPNLGIDLYGKCNIKPACVYCTWDYAKALETGQADIVVDERTLEHYQGFFEGAQTLTNCSFGEPLLHPRLSEILDAAHRGGKILELSTNGQAFTPAVVRALAGKAVILYVSLDAASAATYARLRNERWWEVVGGLTFLREARRAASGLPKVNIVFMPMRANLQDIEMVFTLCRMVEADRLSLRPLNQPGDVPLTADRAGYHFDYSRELLTQAELEDVFRRCEELSAKHRVPIANQFDFGK